MTSAFRRLYGSGPAHLGLLIGFFLVVAYIVSRILGVSHGIAILVWLAGAVIVHDLVLFPIYSGADRVLGLALRRRPERPRPVVAWINHVRVPLVFSGVTLAISFPLVLRLGPATYHYATGLEPDVYLSHWLVLSGAAFLISGLVYATRRLRASRGHRP